MNKLMDVILMLISMFLQLFPILTITFFFGMEIKSMAISQQKNKMTFFTPLVRLILTIFKEFKHGLIASLMLARLRS